MKGWLNRARHRKREWRDLISCRQPFTHSCLFSVSCLSFVWLGRMGRVSGRGSKLQTPGGQRCMLTRENFLCSKPYSQGNSGSLRDACPCQPTGLMCRNITREIAEFQPLMDSVGVRPVIWSGHRSCAMLDITTTRRTPLWRMLRWGWLWASDLHRQVSSVDSQLPEGHLSSGLISLASH